MAEYVQRGGSIVATYETSLYDEWGVRAERLRAGGFVRRVVRRQGRSADAEFVS